MTPPSSKIPTYRTLPQEKVVKLISIRVHQLFFTSLHIQDETFDQTPEDGDKEVEEVPRREVDAIGGVGNAGEIGRTGEVGKMGEQGPFGRLK